MLRSVETVGNSIEVEHYGEIVRLFNIQSWHLTELPYKEVTNALKDANDWSNQAWIVQATF